MAARAGRPSVPSKVHFLNGNPSNKPIGELLDEFSPDVELPTCPQHLKDEARREYSRIGKELERYGLISKLDRGVLAMCAAQWARYVWAEKRIAEINAADPESERGFIDRTPNNYKVMSVYLVISRDASSMYLKLCSELGLTPAARSRVKASNSPQLQLPGMPAADGSEDRPSLRSFAA